jgi:hypothetical protein
MTTLSLTSLDHKIDPMAGAMSGFELMYLILVAIERLAVATERVADTQARMLQRMEVPEGEASHVSTEFV